MVPLGEQSIHHALKYPEHMQSNVQLACQTCCQQFERSTNCELATGKTRVANKATPFGAMQSRWQVKTDGRILVSEVQKAGTPSAFGDGGGGGGIPEGSFLTLTLTLPIHLQLFVR